jgi:hypothetical protein
MRRDALVVGVPNHGLVGLAVAKHGAELCGVHALTTGLHHLPFTADPHPSPKTLPHLVLRLDFTPEDWEKSRRAAVHEILDRHVSLARPSSPLPAIVEMLRLPRLYHYSHYDAAG